MSIKGLKGSVAEKGDRNKYRGNPESTQQRSSIEWKSLLPQILLFGFWKRYEKLKEPNRFLVFILVMAPYWVSLFFMDNIPIFLLSLFYLGYISISRIWFLYGRLEK